MIDVFLYTLDALARAVEAPHVPQLAATSDAVRNRRLSMPEAMTVVEGVLGV